MVSRYDILGRLPAFKNQFDVWTKNQTTQDIIDGIMECHELDKDSYDLIAEQFTGDTVRQTAENVWNFEKKNIPYKIEDEARQTLRVPAGIVALPADCKHYALFAMGVFDSLNRKGIWKVPLAYRFASYDILDSEPGHVFAVLYPGTDDEIWVDPVLSKFDQYLQMAYYTDIKIKPMALVRMSGTPQLTDLSAGEKLNLLRDLRDGLVKERRDQLAQGRLAMFSSRDEEYLQGIAELDAQIARGGIGGIDPGTIDPYMSSGTNIVSSGTVPAPSPGSSGSAVSPQLINSIVSVITSIFPKKDLDHTDDWLDWDKLDIKRGLGAGNSAADVIVHNRSDIPPIEIVSYIRANGLSNILKNTRYGPITLDTIANYLSANGFTDQAAAIKNATALSNPFPTVTTPGVTSAKDTTLLWIVGGAVIFYLFTKK